MHLVISIGLLSCGLLGLGTIILFLILLWQGKDDQDSGTGGVLLFAFYHLLAAFSGVLVSVLLVLGAAGVIGNVWRWLT